MSILLNALNKSKRDESDDLDELIDSPIEEVSREEATPLQSSLLFWLLGVIAFLLLAIFSLMLWQQMNASGQQSNEVAINSAVHTNTQLVDSAQSSLSSQSSLNPSLGTPVQQRNSVTMENNTAASSERDQPSANREENYFESYRPVKSSPKPNIERSGNTQQSKSIESTNRDKIEQSSRRNSSSNHSSNAINDDLPIRGEEQLTDIEAMMVKEVIIDAHVFSEEPNQSFVFVKGELKQEGDTLINSWRLEKIEESAVIINNGILRVRKKL